MRKWCDACHGWREQPHDHEPSLWDTVEAEHEALISAEVAPLDLHEEVRRLRARVAELEAENLRLLHDPGHDTVGKFTTGRTASEESRIAALRELPKTGTKRAALLELLTRAYPRGLSDEQANHTMHWDIRSLNARRKELEEGGWVVKAPWTWRAPSGNEVSVWMLSETAAGMLVG